MALGELVVKIVGDASALQKELGDALGSAETFATKARTAANAAGAAFGAIGLAAAVGIGAMVNSGITAAAEIKKMSALANATAEDFQRMAFAAQSVGIEQDKLADILKDVNDRVGDFITTGGGPMADFFERIAPQVGVTVEQFKRLSGPEALQLYVSSLEKANVSQQEMTFFMEAMASDSTALVPLLRDNAAGLREMSAEAEALGLVTSSIDVAKMEAARASLAQAGSVADAFNKSLATEAAPAVQVVTDRIIEAAKEMGGLDSVARSMIDGVVTGADYVAKAFRGWQIIIQGNIALIKTIAAEFSEAVDLMTGATNDAAEETGGFWAEVWNAAGVAVKGSVGGPAAAITGAVQHVSTNTKELQKAAEDARIELQQLLDANANGPTLAQQLEDARKKADETAAALARANQAKTGSATATPTPSGPSISTAESDAEIQAIRQRLKERSKTFESWRMTQIQADGAFNASQLELFTQYNNAKIAELAAAQQREDAILKDRREKGLLGEKEYNDLRVQLERDHGAQMAEAKKASAEELAAMTSTNPLGFDPLGAQGGDAVRAMQERLQGQYETMAEYNALMLEQLQTQQDQELAILQARYDAELLTTQQFEDLKAGIEAEGAKKRQQVAEAERAAKLSIFGSMFDNVAGLMQSGSRKMFEIGKAASVAGGLISAYEAVMHAYKAGAKVGGPYLGAAYAATAAVAQAANLRRLSSVSFGSGGGSVTSSSGGSVPAASSAGGETGGATAAAPTPSRNISISLAGSFFSADTVRELIGQINEQIGDGATLSAG